MKCPRCSAGITTAPDPGGVVACPGCGARLRSSPRPAAAQPVVAAQPVAAAAASRPAALPSRGGPGPHAGDIDSMLARLDAAEPIVTAFPEQANPNVTLPPGTPLPVIPRPQALPRNSEDDTVPMPARPTAAPAPAPAAVPDSGVTLDALMAEIRDVRKTQAEILELLRGRRSAPFALPSMTEDGGASLGFPDDDVPALPRAAPAPVTPVRTRRRKTVLLMDDDEDTRQATVAALQTAEVPVRAVSTGNEGLAAIAESKPDVIVMELAMAGDMGGKDVINMIKATMEWVDVPILLYTRAPIESQKEARTIHGADEYVLKSAGAEALVARVITIFRKG